MATITKRPSGYQAKIRMKGHPGQSATFTKLGDAKRWASATEAAMREQRYFKTSESEQHTLAELILHTVCHRVYGCWLSLWFYAVKSTARTSI